ncbi:hypothetical protein [Luteimonas sp. MC1750]|uniref:hypothetical protein n=1 Tax=Luteimonas sp. MC1750 TaxID=2799326 RepID=UPI0018F0B30F|nr:hypothetical protein [Luteimonas sp. MC1750]MBJ6984037.1 hypothetical protein [Luteimonas sp. MC1750]QQO06849.1 hypothetical protein JGR68_05325 [Luteimonas sp. MC1750]
MSAYTNHEKQGAEVKAKYSKYEAQYNATFAADPSKQDRKFDELAPADAKQWARLETFRGNDRDARAAYLDHPNSSTKPTPKEERMWDANQADRWAIDREPAFGQHPATNNKWLDMSLEERRSDRGQKLFEAVDAKYGPSYDKWAQRAGPNIVSKDTYLEGLTVNAHESVSARQQQAQQTSAQDQQAQQAPVRTRVSLSEFASASEFTSQKAQELSKLEPKQLENVEQASEKSFRASSNMSVEEGTSKVMELNKMREQQQSNSRTQQAEPVMERERSRGLER